MWAGGIEESTKSEPSSQSPDTHGGPEARAEVRAEEGEDEVPEQDFVEVCIFKWWEESFKGRVLCWCGAGLSHLFFVAEGDTASQGQFETRRQLSVRFRFALGRTLNR